MDRRDSVPQHRSFQHTLPYTTIHYYTLHTLHTLHTTIHYNTLPFTTTHNIPASSSISGGIKRTAHRNVWAVWGQEVENEAPPTQPTESERSGQCVRKPAGARAVRYAPCTKDLWHKAGSK